MILSCNDKIKILRSIQTPRIFNTKMGHTYSQCKTVTFENQNLYLNIEVRSWTISFLVSCHMVAQA